MVHIPGFMPSPCFIRVQCVVSSPFFIPSPCCIPSLQILTDFQM